ncbi:hypothetical protein [Nocardia asteroides]
MSPSPAATGWTGRPYTGGALGRLAVVGTAIGWFYVVLAVLGLVLSGTMSWAHLGAGTVVTVTGVVLMMTAGYRRSGRTTPGW